MKVYFIQLLLVVGITEDKSVEQCGHLVAHQTNVKLHQGFKLALINSNSNVDLEKKIIFIYLRRMLQNFIYLFIAIDWHHKQQYQQNNFKDQYFYNFNIYLLQKILQRICRLMSLSTQIEKQDIQDEEILKDVKTGNKVRQILDSIPLSQGQLKSIKIALVFIFFFIVGVLLIYFLIGINQGQHKVDEAGRNLNNFQHQRYKFIQINRKRQNDYKLYLKQEEKKVVQLAKENERLNKIMEQKDYLKPYYTLEFPQRTKIERPKIADYQFNLWKLFNTKNYQTGKKSCVFINSIGLVTQNTIKNIKNLLKCQQFGSVYLLASRYDYEGEFQIEKSLDEINKHMKSVILDADYTFSIPIKNQCSKIAYMFQNFVLNEEMINNIQVQTKDLRPSSLFYSSKYSDSKNIQISLPDLSNQDLSLLQPQVLNKYLYIFDTEFLNVITPVNFLFYAKYTIEQILLMPILVLYQSSNKLYTNSKILHSFTVSFVQHKQIALKSMEKQNNSICYISYSNNPSQIDKKSLLSYLESIKNQTLFLDSENKNEMNLSVIIYLPYNLHKNPELYDVAKQLLILKKYHNSFRVRLRIRKERALSSYAVYDSVYTYCPDKSLIVSSRHNVIFYQNMAKQLLNSVTESFHYFTFNIEKQNSEIISFQGLKYKIEEQRKNWNIYEEKLQHVQVFKSDLLKTGVFFVLKSQQIDFYQTEASFVLLMMKLTFVSFNYVKSTLAKYFVREYTELELRQVKVVKSYGKMDGLVWNWMFPYQQNSLENQVMKRNAPKKIPANIHQIWFTMGNIDRIRKVLKNSLVEKNKNFTFYLWTRSDLMRANAPITYDLIERVLEHHKQFPKSLYAMAADMWRYQLIVNYGGLYIDFKFEGVKPLDNFLKYQNIFADFDVGIIRYGVPKAVGNPVMGATKNNYYLKYTLAELINEQKFQFDLIIPKVTGAYELRRALSDCQLFTGAGYGFYFFHPTPYENEKIVNECGGVNKTFDLDQEVFSIDFYKSAEPILIGIPCKQYPQSYIINYNPLGQTWLINKTTTSK